MSKAQEALRALGGAESSGAATRLPGIPTVPHSDDANLVQFMSALKQTVETWAGQRGDTLDSAVTWRELVNKQFATLDTAATVEAVKGSTSGSSSEQIAATVNTLDFLTPKATAASSVDYTPPPAPKNLVCSGAMVTIILDWDLPTHENHSYTEIWRSDDSSIGNAVKVGMSPGGVYTDSVGSSRTYYYWIRFISAANVAGPFNSAAGTIGSTSADPSYILELLSGALSETQLAVDLASRIDLIDAPAGSAGSVNFRIGEEAKARAAALIAEAAARTTAIQQEATQRQTADESLAQQVTTLSAHVDTVNSDVTAAIQSEATARSTADAAETTARETLATTVTNNYNTLNAAIQSEATARSTADTAETTARQTLASTVTSNYNTLNAAIQSEATARANADAAETTARETLAATVTSNYNTLNAAIQNEATARANADAATASSITTIQAQVDSISTTTGAVTQAQLTAAVQTEATARATADGQLQAQYTVKVDANGYVSGFGLASTAKNATPTSAFIINADTFAFAPPYWNGYPQASTTYPFVVYNSSALMPDGSQRPAGVYLKEASIETGSITTAKIAQGAITTAKIADASITAAKIDQAFINSLTVGDASVTTAKIANAAVTNAKIGNLAVDSAKIADGAITSAKIVTAAITEAKIADAAITNAKISGTIQSSNFVSGSTGWRIDKNGGCEFGPGSTFRGSLSVSASSGLASTSITSSTITVKDSAGNTRVQIGMF